MNTQHCDEIVDRNANTMYKLALSYTKNKQDAEDIVQDVFYRYYKKHPTFESTEHEKAWFIRVTINRCKSVLTSAFRRHSISLNEYEIAEEISGISINPNMYDNKDDFVNAYTLFTSVNKLPPKQRLCLHLYYYEDMTIDEIANCTGIKNNTVKSLLLRARNYLYNDLKGDISYGK